MKNKGMTKQKQQELLLCEARKTLKKDLNCGKRRKNLTEEEIIKMREDHLKWDERVKIRKNFTPLEQLQFEFWIDKRRILTPKIEDMVFHCKHGPWDKYLEELQYFNIDVRDMLLRIIRLREERDNFHNRVHELHDMLIVSLKDNIKDEKELIKMHSEILGIPLKSPLRIVK